MQMNIKFKRLTENAIAPVKAHAADAGFDLTCSSITTEINERGQLIIVYHTGLAFEIPEGYFGALVPRSSIANKTLTLTNCIGVIDAGYRGEVMAKMKATTDVIPAVYKPGERFAQLIIIKKEDIEPVEAEELTPSDRGEGGFGSTGNAAPVSTENAVPTDEGQSDNITEAEVVTAEEA